MELLVVRICMLFAFATGHSEQSLTRTIHMELGLTISELQRIHKTPSSR